MSFVILVGTQGRMSQALQNLLQRRKISYKIFGAPGKTREIETFDGASGVIDFSLPAATSEILEKAVAAKVPVVCGTTGWTQPAIFSSLFQTAAQKIPIVWDSNFSLGIELLCQSLENLALHCDGPFEILDRHHIHKKDAPSGTALKIKARIEAANPKAVCEIESIREGEDAGEHRVSLRFGDESLELSHQAYSREIFAAGALKALEWVQNQPAGLYSMKEVIDVIH